MIPKITEGREISGVAFEVGGKYKDQCKSISYKCGKCKKSDRFIKLESKADTYQCIKCGYVNILESELDIIKETERAENGRI